jgi:hypothetical protein
LPRDLKFASYYRSARRSHPEVRDEWVVFVLSEPAHREVQSNGRVSYWRYIPEMKHWLRVIVEGDAVHNAFFDRTRLRVWGIPNDG